MNGDQNAPISSADVPVVRVQVSVQHRRVRVEGLRMQVPDHKSVHEAAVHAAAVMARRSGGPRWCVAEDEAGQVSFLVHPDGHSSDVRLISHAPGVDDGDIAAGVKESAGTGAPASTGGLSA